MVAFLTVIHVLVSIVLIISILMQSSKGSGLSGMFGGGAGSSMLGGRGAATFLSKVTMWAGIAFALTSITIGLITSGTSGEQRSFVEQMAERESETSTPATLLPTIPAADQGGQQQAPDADQQE
ncbi:preprotein translocase subunit SecG [bacterium]|nr:preprotein translocase subunit SecG [bacterium]